MDIINMTCAEIQTAVGFVYKILPVILNHTINDPDCEQSWYTEDRHLIADPSDPETLIDPVISVSSDHLVTSHCVDQLHHEIQCHSKGITHETIFRVFNDTDSSGGSTQTPDSHQFWWISALFFITVVFLLLICFLLRKRIFRYFLKAEKSNFQLSDSEIRDPESAVQKKLRSDESDSLNHSESEQINSSCPEDHPVITLNVIH
ncbi:uncharacterized protein LOC127508206 [Ctenopharyngodon idella]|uniref:uncharacterized protein LOC127508206 n=1 Tax=Ctenopharyngodon idella TaxID=7959 RepID=UPI002230ED49|nr:uncharacterized protein LOC127508206 [Ctenopharyngodon idella]XP_051741937.1 uncharacterized protein LOC127508206 [Ctenopharyngodon idella]